MLPPPKSAPDGRGTAGWLALLTLVALVAFAAGRRSAVHASPPPASMRPAAADPGSIFPASPPMAAAFPSTRSTADSRDPPAWDADDWARLRSKPGSTARNAALAARLEQLARSDPSGAMALALTEQNLLLREKLVLAVLRGWADASPEEAVRQATLLTEASTRDAAVETVLGRLAENRPIEALRLGKLLCRQDPGAAAGHACTMARALCTAGHFDLAAGFASAPGELGAVGRSILTAQTYAEWARCRPEAAARAAAALPDPAARLDALNAVVGGWGQADPAGLTRYVAQLPAGPERVQMLGQSLRQWADLDADAAIAWVAETDAGPGLDDGIAAVAGAGFLKPETAAEWAGGIANPGLRSQTVLALLRTWVNTDPNAARLYFERTPHLLAEDRKLAAPLFAPPASS